MKLNFEFSLPHFEFWLRTRECAKIFPDYSSRNVSHNADNRAFSQWARPASSPHHQTREGAASDLESSYLSYSVRLSHPLPPLRHPSTNLPSRVRYHQPSVSRARTFLLRLSISHSRTLANVFRKISRRQPFLLNSATRRLFVCTSKLLALYHSICSRIFAFEKQVVAHRRFRNRPICWYFSHHHLDFSLNSSPLAGN